MYRILILSAAILSVTAHAALSEGTPRLRLVSDRTHDLYLSFWPKSHDPWLNSLKKKHIIFYDDHAMPHAYQDWDGALQGVHSPSYNISAVQPREPFGNANREFPWGSPAGLHDSPNFKAFRFVFVPEGKSIIWWRERLPRDGGRGSYVWQYPAGTTFGEILLVTDPAGYDWTFELRTRTRSDKGWTMNAFRPFTTQKELAERIKELEPKWRDKPEMVKLVRGEAEREERLRLVNMHELITFDATALATQLPAIDHKLVRKLLDTPFKSALGQEWKIGDDGTPAHAPTTNADFHIVPKNYKGGFVEVSSTSCMRCHDSTLKHARDFQALRDWYGRVRGSDNIFSFHIFEPGSISYSGFGGEPRLRQALLDAGLLRPWQQVVAAAQSPEPASASRDGSSPPVGATEDPDADPMVDELSESADAEKSTGESTVLSRASKDEQPLRFGNLSKKIAAVQPDEPAPATPGELAATASDWGGIFTAFGMCGIVAFIAFGLWWFVKGPGK